MRRLRKTMCVLLAFVLLTGAVSAAFTDADKIDPSFTDAVTYMSDKGVIGGFPDGSFKPKDTLTRAQAAKIICTVLEGADKVDAITATANFSDVPAEHWAAKFIGYCADKGIVSGVGNNKFNPSGELTCAAFAKMLLVAFGHDAEKEKLVGENWIPNVQKTLREAGMNYKVGASENVMKREEACQMAYNFMRTKELNSVEGYTQATFKPTSGTMKLLGRAEETAGGVMLNFPCDGVEFTLDCAGTIEIEYSTEATHHITAFVDSKEFDTRASVNGNSKAVLYRFVEPGEHTIRIVQDSEVNTSGKRVTITGVVTKAKGTPKATAKKNLYIEYVGASTVAGCGTLGTPKDAWSTAMHAGTKSWAYLASDLLDVDYSIVAKGGIGFLKESGKVVYKPMYLLQNAWADKDRAASFSRTPDIVVVASGGNDKATDPDTAYYVAFKEFLQLTREKVGPKAKIVLTYNSMSNDKHLEAEEQAIKELGGEASGFYMCMMPRSNNGVIATGASTPHPSAADNVKIAATFAEFVNTKKLLK